MLAILGSHTAPRQKSCPSLKAFHFKSILGTRAFLSLEQEGRLLIEITKVRTACSAQGACFREQRRSFPEPMVP